MIGNIIATHNLKTNEWDLDTTNTKYQNDLVFIFTEQASVVNLRDLDFGYELRKNDQIVNYKVYPLPRVRYIKSDQDYLERSRIHLDIGDAYILRLWMNNKNGKITKDFYLEIDPR